MNLCAILRSNCHRFFMVYMLLILVVLFSLPAHADGGAPQLAYVAGTTQGISIIDIAKRRITGSIAVAGDPHTVLLSPDGHALYVAQPEPGRVAVIDAKTRKTICSASLPGQPSLLALSIDASVLYAAGQGDTIARALDPSTCAVERTFQTHEPIYGLAVAASTAQNATPSTPNQLWITGSTALTVYEVNGHLLGAVPITGGPQYITIPGGFTAYVTTRQGTVVAVDLNTRHVERTLLSGGEYGTMDYDATTSEVYVPDKKHNLLDVLLPVAGDSAVTPQEPERVIRLSGSPQSVAITNDGQLAFVALSNGQVLMLDIPGRSTIASFAVGGTPHFIITGLYPPAISPVSTQQPPANPTASTMPFSQPFLVILTVVAVLLLLCTLVILWRNYLKKSGYQRSDHKRL